MRRLPGLGFGSEAGAAYILDRKRSRGGAEMSERHGDWMDEIFSSYAKSGGMENCPARASRWMWQAGMRSRAS